MNKFLQLNRQKLKPVFVRLSLTSVGPVTIFLLLAYITGNLPGPQLLLSILLAAGIGFPVFLMLLVYLSWLLKQTLRQKAFSKNPFDQMENIGFYKSYTDEISKWSFTEEIMEGKLNSFILRMDLSKEKQPHYIEFDIPLEWKKINKNEFKRLSKSFKLRNATFRIGSIAKHYDTRQKALQSISDLKQDLELFTLQLKQEGFEPKSLAGLGIASAPINYVRRL